MNCSPPVGEFPLNHSFRLLDTTHYLKEYRMHNYLSSDKHRSAKPQPESLSQHLCAIIMALLLVAASYTTAEAQTAPRLYIADSCGFHVTVLDTATNTFVGDGLVG